MKAILTKFPAMRASVDEEAAALHRSRKDHQRAENGFGTGVLFSSPMQYILCARKSVSDRRYMYIYRLRVEMRDYKTAYCVMQSCGIRAEAAYTRFLSIFRLHTQLSCV